MSETTKPDHRRQLLDLLAYYESLVVADCPHAAANRDAIRWALAELDGITQWVNDEIRAKTKHLEACFVREAERRMAAEVEAGDLRDQVAALTAEPPMMFEPAREPTENERHLFNLLSWREVEALQLKEEVTHWKAKAEGGAS